MEDLETNINVGPEPIEKTVYVIFTEVDKLYLDKSTGIWYAHFMGSWESLAFGEVKPWEVGAKIKITFEEVTDAIERLDNGTDNEGARNRLLTE